LEGLTIYKNPKTKHQIPKTELLKNQNTSAPLPAGRPVCAFAPLPTGRQVCERKPIEGLGIRKLKIQKQNTKFQKQCYLKTILSDRDLRPLRCKT
jgi:hypothetical protein